MTTQILTLSAQLYEQTKRAKAAFAELEWIALHYDEATDEQRARFDAFSAALDQLVADDVRNHYR